MTGTLYPAQLSAHGPCRTLDDYLADLLRRYNALPMTHQDRGKLAVRIRDVEAEIDARSGA